MKHSQTRAFTLTEMLVVMAIIGLLVGMSVPAYNSIMKSHRNTASKNLIRASLLRAKAHAAGTQRYTGIRFQFGPGAIDPAGDEAERKWLTTKKQYLVLIEKVSNSTLYDFAAVADVKPSILPPGVVVMANNLDFDYDGDVDVQDFDEDIDLLDGTTFSIIFSPSGEMVVKTVQIVRRNDPSVVDAIFGDSADVDDEDRTSTDPPASLLYFDDPSYMSESFWVSAPWCQEESSMTGFVLFEIGSVMDMAWGEELRQFITDAQPTLINAYTGSLLEDDEVLGK